jgi:RNA polymerase sigma factor (sigma-70 family)
MDDEKLSYDKLSDTDLIQRFCTDQPDQDAFAALWKRYEQTLHKYCRRFTIMCPRSHSRDIFTEDIFRKTEDKVMRKIGGFKATARFSTWLYRIVERTAIEVRRKIEGRDRKGPRIRVPITDDELSDDSALFRDKVKHDPFRAASKRELKMQVRGVLRDYVGSKEGYDSFQVVRLYAVDECPVREIAAQLGTYEKKIYRMLDHDYEQLEASFRRAGIKNFSEH